MNTTEADQYTPTYMLCDVADRAIGCIYILCFIVGIPGNIASITFFYKDQSSSRRKAYFRILFLVTASVDLTTCLTLPPQIEQFFNDRSGYLFNLYWLCAAWGFIWEIIPYYSVFVLGVTSISRTCTMLLPLRPLNNNLMISGLVAYVVYTVLIKTIPFVDSSVRYIHSTSAAYCYLSVYYSDVFSKVVNITIVVQLALPFIPIFISCATSIYFLYKMGYSPRARAIRDSKTKSTSIQNSSTVVDNNSSPSMDTLRQKPKKHRKRKSITHRLAGSATLTIVLMTVVYVILNIPVFMNYVVYLTSVISPRPYSYYYRNTFMVMYYWNLNYVLFVAINAT